MSRQMRGALEIKNWLSAHPECRDAWVVLDDELSGTGFASWSRDLRRFVVLCQAGVGLQKDEVLTLRQALTTRTLGVSRS